MIPLPQYIAQYTTQYTAKNSMTQKQPNQKKDTVMIWVRLPVRINKRLSSFKDMHGLKSKGVAVVKILDAFLFPVVNGDA